MKMPPPPVEKRFARMFHSILTPDSPSFDIRPRQHYIGAMQILRLSAQYDGDRQIAVTVETGFDR